MTKTEIIEKVAAGTGMTKVETEAVVNGFLKSIIDALTRGDYVEIRGFGTFRVKERAPRTGRNPRTGKVVRIEAQHVPFLKVSKEVRKLVDESIKGHPDEADIDDDLDDQEDDD